MSRFVCLLDFVLSQSEDSNHNLRFKLMQLWRQSTDAKNNLSKIADILDVVKPYDLRKSKISEDQKKLQRLEFFQGS